MSIKNGVFVFIESGENLRQIYCDVIFFEDFSYFPVF